jgi:hypothetical protein
VGLANDKKDNSFDKRVDCAQIQRKTDFPKQFNRLFTKLLLANKQPDEDHGQLRFWT